MAFLAGVIAGCALGVVAGVLLQRRAGGSSLVEGRGFATTIAILALVVGAVALARSGRDRDHTAATGGMPGATSTTGTTPAVTATPNTPSTSAASQPTGLVAVPNVSHPPLTRKDAVDILKRAGLQVSIESLPLANVPAGFVISQNPLPAAMATTGSTVTLVVSAPA